MVASRDCNPQASNHVHKGKAMISNTIYISKKGRNGAPSSSFTVSISNKDICLREVKQIYQIHADVISINDSVFDTFIKSVNTTETHTVFYRKFCAAFSSSTVSSKRYWTERGHSEQDASKYVTAIQKRRAVSHKSKYTPEEYKIKNQRKSRFTVPYWTDKGLSEKDAIAKISEIQRKLSKRCPEYWVSKGYSTEEAESKVSDHQKEKFAPYLDAVRSGETIHLTGTCLQYFLNKGLSFEDATEALSKRQSTFSKDKCVTKYGPEVGFQIFTARQEKWQSTLNAKPPEERARINELKMWKGGCVSEAETELALLLAEYGCSQQTAIVTSNCCSIVDISKGNKVIEYYGDYWHSNPVKYSPEYFNKQTNMTACEKWSKDCDRINNIITNGYSVMIVWENDFKLNKTQTILNCIKFLEE